MRVGQTPGQKAFNLVVVNENLTPISRRPSLPRNLLRFADLPPFAYAAGVTSMTLNRNFRRLGDMAAGNLWPVARWRKSTAHRQTQPHWHGRAACCRTS